MDSTAALRPAGLLEKFFIARHHLKAYNSVAVTARYNASIKVVQAAGGIDKLVYAALKSVIHQHPILGVTVTDAESPELNWVRLESIDLERIVSHVEVDPKSSLDKVIEDAHATEFEPISELPLWRIVVFARDAQLKGDEETVSFAIGFFFHHGIADGMSGGVFHLTLLSALNASPQTTSNHQTIIPVPKVPLVPNVELNTPFPVTYWFIAKKLFNEFVFSRSSALEWTGPVTPTAPPTTPPTINLRSFALPPTAIARLLTKCRAESTSITALLTVLMARKLSLMYPTHSRFTGQIPFSLRKFSGHGPLDMGAYLDAVMAHFSSELPTPSGYISCAAPADGAEDTSLWESARATRASVVAWTSSPANQGVGLIKFVKDNLPGFFLGKLGKPREAAFEVSNIMSFDGAGDEVSFDKIQFSATLATYAVPYLLDIASVKGGEMTLCFGWNPEVVERKDAMVLVDWFESQLRSLSGL